MQPIDLPAASDHRPTELRTDRVNRVQTPRWIIRASLLSAGVWLAATLAGAGSSFTQIGDAAYNRAQNVPNGGRLSVVAPVPTDPLKIFVGASNGGVWRTLDGGVSWDTRTDGFTSLSISALATDSSGTRVFAATWSPVRLLRSFDGGNSFQEWIVPQLAYLNDHLGQLIVDAAHANTVYARTTRGVLRSQDDGTTWQVVFPPDDRHVEDMAVMAGGQFWVLAARGGRLYRSPTGDPGTFSEITLPPPGDEQPPYLGAFPYLRLAPVPGQLNRIYLTFGGQGDATYRSDDYGAAPFFVSRHDRGIGQPTFTASGDGTTLYSGEHSSGNTSVNRWANQGALWQKLTGSYHPDIMALETLASPNRLFAATDGGLWRYDEAGQTWANLNGNLANLLLYNAYASRGTKNAIVGGTQDNGVLTYRGVKWWIAGGGDMADGFLLASDPQLGGVMATIVSNDYLEIEGDTAMYLGYEGPCERPEGGQFAVDPNHPDLVCVATGPIHCSFSKGRDPWCFVTEDLGAIEMVMVDTLHAWARTSGQTVIRTSNGMLGTWIDVTSNLPQGQLLDVDAPEGGDPLHALALVGTPELDPQVYETTNGGQTWTALGIPPVPNPGGIPPICSSPPCPDKPEANPQVTQFGVNFTGPLYQETWLVGTSHGLLESTDRGVSWHATNMPHVEIRDIDTYRGVATIATHGRGVWQRDLAPEFPEIYEVEFNPFWWLKHSPVEQAGLWASDLLLGSDELLQEVRLVSHGGRAFRRGDEPYGTFDFPLVPGSPLMTRAEGVVTVDLEGSPAGARPLSLQSGWNPVGVPDGAFASAGELLQDVVAQGIAGAALADGGGQQGYAPEAIRAAASGRDFAIDPTEGYWLYVCGDGGVWTPGAGRADTVADATPTPDAEASPTALVRQPAGECPDAEAVLAGIPEVLARRVLGDILACLPMQYVSDGVDRVPICDTPPPLETDQRMDNVPCSRELAARGCAITIRPSVVREDADGRVVLPFGVEANGTATLPDGSTCPIGARDDEARMILDIGNEVDPPVIHVWLRDAGFEELEPVQDSCGPEIDGMLGALVAERAREALFELVAMRVRGLGPVCSPEFPLPDADEDLTPDCNDGCPEDPSKTDPGACGCGVVDDGDGDGRVVCGEDCDDTNATLWSVPGRVGELNLSHDPESSMTELSWSPPEEPGGTVLRYDVIRAWSPEGFALDAECVESDDGSDTRAEAFDGLPAGGIEYFLVRAGNRCGDGALEPGANGEERQVRSCP